MHPMFSQKKVVGDYIENVPLLHSNGSGWGFYIDERLIHNKKKILFIGDSILMGYKSVIVEKNSDYFFTLFIDKNSILS